MIGIVASQWVGVALIIVALCVTLAIGAWAGRRGNALVVAVAILLFWMPFQTTVSRLDVSPQEISVYAICTVCALFDRRGVWQWSKDLFTTTSAFMRLAILVFVYPAYSPSCGSRIQTCWRTLTAFGLLSYSRCYSLCLLPTRCALATPSGRC